MIYAKITGSTFLACDEQVYQAYHVENPDWLAFDVPSAEHLSLVDGELVIIEPVPVSPVLSKQERLDSIVVTTQSGKQFDGNQTARVNMLAAITLASFAGQTSTSWKLANNTVETVTLSDLQEALHLAMLEVAEIVGAA